MSRPIPVPSECIDLTPTDMWDVYWELYPQGTELPAAVPGGVWSVNWKRRAPESERAKGAPPPPALLRGYWGRMKGRALEGRKKRNQDAGSGDRDAEAELGSVRAPKMCDRFWQRYFELFPTGHSAPPSDYSGPAARADPADSRASYGFFRGQLCVNVASSGPPVWRPSTGADKWNADGSWGGGQ